MFRSVLVANRGEIACRVFRTAQRMGIETVAVYSEADAGAPHVRMADKAVLIGPAPARESYLVAEKVLQAARDTGADAIHPGYGFLSENAEFAEAVEAAGLIWIGPKPSSIRAMGLKDAAKDLMDKAGVPVTPGYLGEDQSLETLQKAADSTGYPVLIKAVAGGGGKGMKKVERAGDFASALASAQRESKAAFGDDRVLIEKYVTRPRHIEVQVFGDTHGNVVHLYERDCSLQRRHQKVIEEAPAPGMDDATRKAVTDAAVKAAKAVDYVGAGTVEFIADASEGLKGDRIWFMEMNTRLQVEHPVTEAVTGQDLVEWQFRVAAGEPLPLKQDEIQLDGWAMEARLYAEDPAGGFLPSIGPLDHFVLPDDDAVRVETGVEQGGEVSQFYDPMIAKLIVHAEDRESAAAGLADACSKVEVWPVKTNAGFLVRCLDHPDFVDGDVDTGFIAGREEELVTPDNAGLAASAALGSAALARLWALAPGERVLDAPSVWQGRPDGLFGFRLNASPRAEIRLEDSRGIHAARLSPGGSGAHASEDSLTLELGEVRRGVRQLRNGHMTVGDEEVSLIEHDGRCIVFVDGDAFAFSEPNHAGTGGGAAPSDGSLRAPMPGKVVAVQAKAGDTVAKGQPLVVVEAMKMEHALTAPFDGVVAEVSAAVGDQVADGAVLAKVEAAE
jgi:3-methylcrotonyl-CoA carboxylase alpha subunit